MLKKIFLFILVFIIALAAFVFVFKNQLLAQVLETAVTNLTGFETQVGSLDLQATKGIIHLKGLKIHNPPRFSGKIFADIPEVYIGVNIDAILKKEKIHLPKIVLAIQEINIEKDAEGISNVSLLTSAGKGKEQAPAAKPAEPAAKGEAMPFQLDELHLTIRNVRLEDRSKIVPAKVAVDLGIQNQVFTNIHDPKALVNLVLMKILHGTTFGNLNLGINPAEIEGALKDTVGMGTDMIKNTTNQLAGTALETLGATENVMKSTLNTAGGLVNDPKAGVASGVKQIGGMFGSLKSQALQGLSGNSTATTNTSSPQQTTSQTTSSSQ